MEWGIGRYDLYADRYEWKFINQYGVVRESGVQACRKAPSASRGLMLGLRSFGNLADAMVWGSVMQRSKADRDVSDRSVGLYRRYNQPDRSNQAPDQGSHALAPEWPSGAGVAGGRRRAPATDRRSVPSPALPGAEASSYGSLSPS